MALFNVPLQLQDHADRAIVSAMEILEKLKEINQQWERAGRPHMAVGIGINSGDAIVGNMGTSVRFDYTAVGDTINLASRLEGLCKYYGVELIVSETTVREAKKQYPLIRLDYVRVKGRQRPLWIYTLCTLMDESSKALYQKALDSFFEKNFNEALALVEKIPEPPVFVQVFRDKLLATISQQLPENWDGATNFQIK